MTPTPDTTKRDWAGLENPVHNIRPGSWLNIRWIFPTKVSFPRCHELPWHLSCVGSPRDTAGCVAIDGAAVALFSCHTAAAAAKPNPAPELQHLSGYWEALLGLQQVTGFYFVSDSDSDL